MKEKLVALEADPASISQDMFESKIHYENKITALEQKVAALKEELVQKDSLIEGKDIEIANLKINNPQLMSEYVKIPCIRFLYLKLYH